MEQCEKAFKFGAFYFADHAQEGSKTYVHCKAGRGRSTTLVLCYLIKFFNQDPEQAYAFVRQKRPQVCLEFILYNLHYTHIPSSEVRVLVSFERGNYKSDTLHLVKLSSLNA